LINFSKTEMRILLRERETLRQNLFLWQSFRLFPGKNLPTSPSTNKPTQSCSEYSGVPGVHWEKLSLLFLSIRVKNKPKCVILLKDNATF
jgi:hypothetical protein